MIQCWSLYVHKLVDLKIRMMMILNEKTQRWRSRLWRCRRSQYNRAAKGTPPNIKSIKTERCWADNEEQSHLPFIIHLQFVDGGDDEGDRWYQDHGQREECAKSDAYNNTKSVFKIMWCVCICICAYNNTKRVFNIMWSSMDKNMIWIFGTSTSIISCRPGCLTSQQTQINGIIQSKM